MGEWNGNRNDYHGNNRNNWGDNRSNNRSNNNGRHSSSKPPKLSGAKFGQKEENYYVNAWKKNKYGFFTLFAWPYNKSQVKESKSGKEWISLFVTITNRSNMNVTHTAGMYDIQRKRLYLKELNQIVTRNGAGGYWGKHISKSYNR